MSHFPDLRCSCIRKGLYPARAGLAEATTYTQRHFDVSVRKMPLRNYGQDAHPFWKIILDDKEHGLMKSKQKWFLF